MVSIDTIIEFEDPFILSANTSDRSVFKDYLIVESAKSKVIHVNDPILSLDAQDNSGKHMNLDTESSVIIKSMDEILKWESRRSQDGLPLIQLGEGDIEPNVQMYSIKVKVSYLRITTEIDRSKPKETRYRSTVRFVRKDEDIYKPSDHPPLIPNGIPILFAYDVTDAFYIHRNLKNLLMEVFNMHKPNPIMGYKS